MKCIDIGKVEKVLYKGKDKKSAGNRYIIVSEDGEFHAVGCLGYGVLIEVPGFSRVVALDSDVSLAIQCFEKAVANGKVTPKEGMSLPYPSDNVEQLAGAHENGSMMSAEELEDLKTVEWVNAYGVNCEEPFDSDEIVETARKRLEKQVRRYHFSELFYSELYIDYPLRWNGYGIVSFLHGGKGSDNAFQNEEESIRRVCSTLEFPERMLHVAALYFLQQRLNKDYGFPQELAAADEQQDDFCGFWSLFYLFYLQLRDESFNPYFRGEWHGKDEDPAKVDEADVRHPDVMRQVVEELCGFRGHDSLFPDCWEYEALSKAFSEAKEANWLGRYRASPEATLGLSFKANGFAQIMCQEGDGLHPPFEGRRPEECLEEIARNALARRVRLPEDDWKARAVMFVLAHAIFIEHSIDLETSKCGHAFAILYLRFYRQGPDPDLSRSQFRAQWNAYSFAEKEAVAAKFRRMLAKTRNEAARRYPDPQRFDFP